MTTLMESKSAPEYPNHYISVNPQMQPKTRLNDRVMWCNKATIEVSASPEKVFAYVSDLRRHHEWSAQPLVIDSASADTTAVGARSRSWTHQFGRDNKNELVVVENMAPRRFAFEASGRDGRFMHSFDLEPIAAGTRLTKTFLVIKANPVISLLRPMFAIFAPRGIAGDVKRIKAKLEP